jgi:hypothetical protein
MPQGKKQSKTTKLKRQGAHTTFVKHSRRAPSLESSEYCVSDNHSSESIVCLGRAINVEEIDNESEEEVEAAVEALQSFYSGFLPPHLHQETKTRAECHKIANRPVFYTGGSQSTFWRKGTALRNAAKGCATLDTFVVRKVCISQPRKVELILKDGQKWQRSPSPAEIEEIAPPPVSMANHAEYISDSDIPMPLSAHSNASTENRGEILAQSVANLAINADDLITSSAANCTTASADLAINDAIDQLTEQLTAFCFKHLERRIDSSTRDWDNHVDVNWEETFESELSVHVTMMGYSII